MTLWSPIRDGARLNDSGARLDKGVRLGGSCVGPASDTRDSTTGERSCKTVNTAAEVPARAVVPVRAVAFSSSSFSSSLLNRSLT